MNIKRLCRQFLLPGLVAILWLSVTSVAIAADDDNIHLNLSVSEGTVTYQVVSDTIYEQAVAITTIYKNGRMVDSHFDYLAIPASVTENSHTFTAEFDDVKVMLVDAFRFTPLCAPGGYQNVTFVDYDGTALSTQKLLSGQSATPPAVSAREGYLFTGWDGSYDAVYSDSIFTAQYIPEDSSNIFTVSSAESSTGEKITISVALSGTVKLCGYDMNLLYDNTVLELVSLDSELSMDVLANPIAGEGRVKFNFTSRSDRTKSGDIMDITFRVLDTDAAHTAIRLKPIKVIAIDPEDSLKFIDADYTVCEGGVWIK